MDPFIFRSLIFALIEFSLAILVLRKGKLKRIPLALTLICLGGYQLGEFMFLSTDNQFGVQFAAFSTTLLPPFGFLILAKAKWEKILYILVQVVGLGFAFSFLIFPNLLIGTHHQFCLVKYTDTVASSQFLQFWAYYYIIGLISAVLLALYKFIKQDKAFSRKFYLLFIGAYGTFLPTSYFLIAGTNKDFGVLPSVTCALAILAAFIMAWVSLKVKR